MLSPKRRLVYFGRVFQAITKAPSSRSGRAIDKKPESFDFAGEILQGILDVRQRYPEQSPFLGTQSKERSRGDAPNAHPVVVGR